jgi:hypothetical protein
MSTENSHGRGTPARDPYQSDYTFAHAREAVVEILSDGTKPTEFGLSLCTLGLGIWLLLPFGTFATTEAYAILERVAPEWLWGLAWCGAGGFHLFRLLTNGRRRRRQSIFVMYMLWLLMAILTASGNYAGLAAAGYGLMALQAFWVYLRLRPAK